MATYPIFTFKLNGQTVNPPENWMELEILASFEDMNTQANITIEDVTFVNEAAQVLIQWVRDGMNGNVGIFEGVDFEITIENQISTYVAFKGYVATFDVFKIISPVRVVSKIKRINEFSGFSERIEGITYQSLLDLGVYNQSDFNDEPYILETEFEFIQAALLSLAIYSVTTELVRLVKDLSSQVATALGIAGAGITGAVSSVIYMIAQIAINAVYTAAMIIYMTRMLNELIGSVYQPIRYHKGILWKKLLEKSCNYLGYQFRSSISDLNEVFFIPSKTKEGYRNAGSTSETGIPTSQDYGYTVFEQFQMAMTAFDAKLAIKEINGAGVVYLEPLKNESFWFQNSVYQIPDILDEGEEYNTSELNANVLIKFKTDLNEKFTIKNYRGTSYEITTFPIVQNDIKKRGINGLKNIEINAALATRKDGLTGIENTLRVLGGVADGVINFFGGNSNLAGQVANRVGMMRLSNHEIQVAKLIRKQSGSIPINQRDIWSAKHLWENYINRISFVANNSGNQWRLKKDRKIPFGFTDFINLTENSMVSTTNGDVAHVEQIKWKISEDYAIVDYRIRKPYTSNLRERYHEEG